MNTNIIIIFLAFFGFCLSMYLRHKKIYKKEPFICPMKGNCTAVIHSEFSKLYGIPVECIGIAYYGFIAIAYGFVTFFVENQTNLLRSLFVISTLAFCFSMYLTFVQVVLLKKLCTWCLLSATFCTVIFLLALQHISTHI